MSSVIVSCAIGGVTAFCAFWATLAFHLAEAPFFLGPAHAGLFGLYLIRDDFETSLNLPRGKYEVPIVLYDRAFDADGQLNYPVSGNPKTPWTPEVFGDAIVVNGKIFPYLEVEPRKYRFRLLNGANGRAAMHVTSVSAVRKRNASSAGGRDTLTSKTRFARR